MKDTDPAMANSFKSSFLILCRKYDEDFQRVLMKVEGYLIKPAIIDRNLWA